jgi:hypothetical protein
MPRRAYLYELVLPKGPMDDAVLIGRKSTALLNFERQRPRCRLGYPMTKLIALIAAGCFAASSAFAGSHGDCTKQAANGEKVACQVSLASLDLTPEQKTKMDAVVAEHEKAGCNAESEGK